MPAGIHPRPAARSAPFRPAARPRRDWPRACRRRTRHGHFAPAGGELPAGIPDDGDRLLGQANRQDVFGAGLVPLGDLGTQCDQNPLQREVVPDLRFQIIFGGQRIELHPLEPALLGSSTFVSRQRSPVVTSGFSGGAGAAGGGAAPAAASAGAPPALGAATGGAGRGPKSISTGDVSAGRASGFAVFESVLACGKSLSAASNSERRMPGCRLPLASNKRPGADFAAGWGGTATSCTFTFFALPERLTSEKRNAVGAAPQRRRTPGSRSPVSARLGDQLAGCRADGVGNCCGSTAAPSCWSTRSTA